MSDIGNRCVHCGEDTAFGSGRFVNRIPADADYEAQDDKGNIIFAEGEYRDGYACAECMALPCDRCNELIPLDEDICASDVYDPDDNGFKQDFSDGSWRVHYKCLTAEEKIKYDKESEDEINN